MALSKLISYYEDYEIITQEKRFDDFGSYYYVSIVGWENKQSRQKNEGEFINVDGQLIRCEIANNFKVRYRDTIEQIITRVRGNKTEGLSTTGEWLPIETEGIEWQTEEVARDMRQVFINCVQRYFTRIQNNIEYQEKIRRQPNRQGTTLNLAIPSGPDDGGYWFTGWLANQNVTTIGRYISSRLMNGFFRFTGVSGLSGATIDAADFNFYVDKENSAPLTNIYCEDSASPTAPTSEADHDGRTRTTNFVAVDNPNYPNTSRQTVSITSVVQELADSYDPSSILVLWDNDGTLSNYNYFEIRTYDRTGADEALLDIDYTAAAGGGGMIYNVPASQRIQMKRHGTYLRR